MVYQPMLELLAYLRANGFKTFIVSGGGVEFMRPWTERVYGIPPEQVVGSSGKLKLEVRDGKPVLIKLPEVDLDRRQGGQAGRHPEPHRPPADRGVRQLRRRPADAGVGDGRHRRALRALRSSRRCGAEFAYDRADKLQQFNKGLGRGGGQGLDRRQHEGRLEGRLPVPEVSAVAYPASSPGAKGEGREASRATAREVASSDFAGLTQSLDDTELAKHRRLLRDEVGVEGVAETERAARRAVAPAATMRWPRRASGPSTRRTYSTLCSSAAARPPP